MQEKEITQFNTWFQKEGKSLIPPSIPSTNYKAIKDLLLIAWLNGAYTTLQDTTLDNSPKDSNENSNSH